MTQHFKCMWVMDYAVMLIPPLMSHDLQPWSVPHPKPTILGTVEVGVQMLELRDGLADLNVSLQGLSMVELAMIKRCAKTITYVLMHALDHLLSLSSQRLTCTMRSRPCMV